ncbi:MAG: GNAT family N-acetyltransferase [Halanaerobiales bacterium]
MSAYIRYANINDSDILGDIHSRSLIASFKGIIPDDFISEHFSYQRKIGLYKELLTGSPDTGIIYKDNQAVGMITIGDSRYTEREDSLIEIWRIYIIPSHWGKGIGSELMTWGINEIRKKDYKKAELWVLEDNNRVREFYQRFGFRHDGTTQIINCGKDLNELRYIIDI